MISHDKIISFYDKHPDEYLFRSCGFLEIYNLITLGFVECVDEDFRVLYLSNNLKFCLGWDSQNYVIAYNKEELKRQGLIEFPSTVLEFIRYCDNDPTEFESLEHTGYTWAEFKVDVLLDFETYIKSNNIQDPESVEIGDIDEFNGINTYQNDTYIKRINLTSNLIHNIYVCSNEQNDNEYIDNYNKLINLLENKISR
jgi:hypothetical protein